MPSGYPPTPSNPVLKQPTCLSYHHCTHPVFFSSNVVTQLLSKEEKISRVFASLSIHTKQSSLSVQVWKPCQ